MDPKAIAAALAAPQQAPQGYSPEALAAAQALFYRGRK